VLRGSQRESLIRIMYNWRTGFSGSVEHEPLQFDSFMHSRIWRQYLGANQSRLMDATAAGVPTGSPAFGLDGLLTWTALSESNMAVDHSGRLPTLLDRDIPQLQMVPARPPVAPQAVLNLAEAMGQAFDNARHIGIEPLVEELMILERTYYSADILREIKKNVAD